MKKSTLYKSGIFGLTLLGAGALISADDAQTNEGKIEMAYAELVTQFNEEQMNICKEQAMEAARMDMQAMQNRPTEGEEATVGGGTVTPPTKTPTSGGSTGGSEPTKTTTPPPPPKKDVVTKTDVKSGKMSGGTEATSETKSTKMSGESNTSTKKGKMSGGK